MKDFSNSVFSMLPAQVPYEAIPPDSMATRLDLFPRLVQRSIEVGWAQHVDQVREAQSLRHQVFATELGAYLSSTVRGHDIDFFDDYCEHMLVRECASGQVIGMYRVLKIAQAKGVGNTHSDTEFDLTRLHDLPDHMVELGRSCVHVEHRNGAVIRALYPDFKTADLPMILRTSDLPLRYRKLYFKGAA